MNYTASELSNNSISFFKFTQRCIIQLFLVRKSHSAFTSASSLLGCSTMLFLSHINVAQALHMCAHRYVAIRQALTACRAELCGVNACTLAHAVPLAPNALGNTYGMGSPFMQRVPKPGVFTKVSTTRDTSALLGASLL